MSAKSSGTKPISMMGFGFSISSFLLSFWFPYSNTTDGSIGHIPARLNAVVKSREQRVFVTCVLYDMWNFFSWNAAYRVS